jgi:hypothetical protein
MRTTRGEAGRFLKQLRERMAEQELELHPEKTRLIEFGRFAEGNRKRDRAGKPETFNFLGFTHICSTIHGSGKFTVKRKTVGKRMPEPEAALYVPPGNSAAMAVNAAAAQSAQPMDVGELPDSD